MTTACSCRGHTDRPQCGSLPLALHKSQHEHIQHANSRGRHHHVRGDRERLQESGYSVCGRRAPLLVVVHRQSSSEVEEIVTVGGRIGGGGIAHRDLVANGRPIGARQSLRREDDVADRGVIDHPWMKDPGDPVTLRPFDGGQLHRFARGGSEPAGGDLAQADLPFPQTLPQHVGTRSADTAPGCTNHLE